MAHKKVHADHGEEGGHGGDKPWVFFMVDAFFLITEFYILTFKFKAEESVLPQKLPPGGSAGQAAVDPADRTKKQQLRVHVSGTGDNATYDFQGISTKADGLISKLTELSSGGGEHTVKVSYEANTEWKDVMLVFNACNKVKIAECGLIQIRDASVK
jgi:biopolymer transport protein ExbD